jgi:hypothetical protein
MHDDTRQPVEFDPETMRLTIGEHSTVVSHPALGNEAVLRSYLSLVAEVRGTPIGSGIQVRHDDVVVLAQVLDLSDSDLDFHLQRLLGVSAATAAEVGRRLRRRHAFAAAAASLTVGGLALFGASKVAASPGPVTPKPTPVVAVASMPEATTTSTTAVPATTTPPATVDTTPEVPATTEPAASDASHTHPTGPDDVQIGDALVIERGQQPDDPSTHIGDAITYER